VAYSLNQSLHLTYLKEDQQQRLWLSIAEYPGVFLLDEASSIFKLFETPLGAVTIARLWEDEKGNLLFGETNKSTFPAVKRLYLLDTQGNWDDFSYFMQIGKYIIAANSKDFYNTTLASTDVGLKVIRNWTPSVQSFLNMEVKDGNRNRVMRGIVSDGADKLFLAEESGDCYELNIQTDVIRPLPLKDIRNGRELKLNCTNQLFFDKKTGKLWGHTCEGDFGSAYLMEIDTATWKVKLHPFKKKIRSFCMDKNDVFWLVCANDANDAEIFYFNPTTAEKRTYRNSEGNNPIKGAYPTSITTDKNGQLIISTYRGLFTIQPEQQISDVLNKDAGLSSNQIYATYETDNNLLLLGTNRGLNVFNKTTQNNEIFLREDGLSSNEVYSIYPANKPNSYWLGTIYGLSFLDLNKKSFKTFFEKDGLTHNEFNRFSSFRDKNGRYYFGGVNGINAFYEEDLVNLGPASKPILSKVQYYDSDKEQIHLQYDNLPLLDRIILQPKDRGLELFFNIPEYADPKSNQFMYRLLGDTEDWKIIGNQNYLTYNALPVGTYKLQIKGAGPIGNWSEEVLEIDLIQTQAFHKSWQFWVICMVLLACLIQFFNQYKLEQKIKLERIRTKLSSDLHDEVSGLLAGIAMQSEMLEMQEKEEKNKILLNKIATTSRSAMSRMGDVIWSIDSRKDKIQDLIARMTEHAMDILDPLEIDWEMKVEKINLDKKIPFLLRQNLYFIFKEAINNIGKHANPNKVLIKIGHEKHHFVLSIFNDGEKKIDMRKSNKTGQGLLNMEMRAKKIDAHLERNLEGGYGIILKRKRIS
jgi:two-component sensor histidine kinase